MGYEAEEDQVYELYKSQGIEEEFYKIKPKMSEQASTLLGAFYKLSQERRMDGKIPKSIIDRDIHYYQSNNGSSGYAPDIFAMAISAIDSEYIKIKCDKIRKQKRR